MKEHLKNLFKNPMLLIFLVVVIFFAPLAIFSPGESKNRGVVTAVGIDRIDDEYEVSLLTFIPTANQSFEEQKSVVSGKGKSVAEAVYNAQITLGRRVGLWHARTTVVSEDLLQEDVAQSLDYLSRVASLPENTVLVCTNKTAKELLEVSQFLRTNIGLKLDQLVGYNTSEVYVKDTSLESFYKGYYSDVRSSIIGYLSVEDAKTEEEGISSIQKAEQNPSEQSQPTSSQAAGEESGGEQANKKQIVNHGDSALIKNGKMVEKLNVDILNGINLLKQGAKNHIITIQSVDKKGNDVKLSYKLKNEKVLSATKFENGCPVYSSQLHLGLELLEINGDRDALKINTEFSDISGEIANSLNLELKKQVTDALNILQANKTDVIGVTEKFYRDNRKAFMDYIKNIDGIDEFISLVTYKINIFVEPD